MPDTITFESLGDAYTDAIDASLELAIIINSVVADGDADLVFAYCEIPLVMASGTGVEAPEVDTIQAYCEILLEMGYTLASNPGACEVELELPITVSSYVDVDTVGEVVIPLTIAATAPLGMIPIGDEPFVEVEEAMLGTTSTSVQEVLSVLEAIVGRSEALTMVNRVIAQGESLSIKTKLTLVLEALAVDTAAFADVVAGDPVKTIALVDALQLAGAAQGSVAAMAVLSDIVALATAVASVQDADAEDTAALAETVEGLVSALESVITSAVFSESVQALAVVTVLVPETMATESVAEALASRLAIAEENLPLAVAFDFDGVPYVGLSMNAATKGITEYDAFDYNSLAWFNGKLYAAGAAGLYRHDADTDAGEPINAFLRTAMQRIAGGKASRI
ncbi:hypothetical protein, partial [uncultured Arenimonas sp.]|uniref:hypothetical protein n=1 Tax=uncultured Arenimonas sp. TaxID=546226 RepID=UPI0030D712EE